jgi:hypothetical protein
LKNRDVLKETQALQGAELKTDENSWSDLEGKWFESFRHTPAHHIPTESIMVKDRANETTLKM